ncbi:MAG: hypothetical protein LBH96_01395 [Candidatus Peribacteria bacterium]|nr:hypothetical protein [Candidatus Peribacteria bacterium]
MITQIVQLRYHPQLVAMSKEEEQLLIDCLHKVRDGKSTVIASNHDTF